MAQIGEDQASLSYLPRQINGTDDTKACVVRTLEGVKCFQRRVRRHIEDNYVDFMPSRSTSDTFVEEGEMLLRETEYLLKNVAKDVRLALTESSAELALGVSELSEASLGLAVSQRILETDELFRLLDESSASKDYRMALDQLTKLECLVYSKNEDEVDRLFQKCQFYDAVKVKYHIQSNLLQQNLQQRFERLISFSEKSFPTIKSVTLKLSKDVSQLQDIVNVLFQAHYNPEKLCDFILNNCLIPIVTMPVSVEFMRESDDYEIMQISYSLTNLNRGLQPSYKEVMGHLRTLFRCLESINVMLSTHEYVLCIIGTHIKKQFLKALVEECLLKAIPETMMEYQESSLIQDVAQFEELLVKLHFIAADTDNELSNFAAEYEEIFRNQFRHKVLENSRCIMKKNLQDIIVVAAGNTAELVESNPSLFPQCMVSKSAVELVALMERAVQAADCPNPPMCPDIIPDIINTYCTEVPRLHEKLLEKIPQQTVVFYNNCMFLAHWLAKNSEIGIPLLQTLVKTLQATGTRVLKSQELQQKQIIAQILKELDISHSHSIGSAPFKLIRQCHRQMDLLKNVWQDVLPDAVYTSIVSSLIQDYCQDIIRRILSLEDISASVANELSELIDIVLDKAPGHFKEKQEIGKLPAWLKLQQLKIILNASLHEISELWCDGVGILTANYTAEEVRRLIKALFQTTDRRAKVLSKIL